MKMTNIVGYFFQFFPCFFRFLFLFLSLTRPPFFISNLRTFGQFVLALFFNEVQLKFEIDLSWNAERGENAGDREELPQL